MSELPTRTDGLTLARVIQGLAVVAVLAAGLLAARIAGADAEGRTPTVVKPQPSSLSSTLERCRLAGPSSSDDPACRSAWSESRARFFTRPVPEDRHD